MQAGAEQVLGFGPRSKLSRERMRVPDDQFTAFVAPTVGFQARSDPLDEEPNGDLAQRHLLAVAVTDSTNHSASCGLGASSTASSLGSSGS
ncbi:hypothetical protein [Rhodococcus xishaensis]|uniref:hypothetical protein n=1 Tax=Rhodococcus xishaensis TaxID=2487364 RepID=UPI000FDEB022|nr:hypothetical protein [Rhodococcus xishaensis]